MNRYLIALLLSACTFNSYGMFKKKEPIAPATPPAPPRSETEIKTSNEKIDRQIILYYLRHDIPPAYYTTPIPKAFADEIIAEYQKEEKEFANQRFADMQALLCKTDAILKKVNL